MKGLRGYDMFLSGVARAGQSWGDKSVDDYKRSMRGLPVFLADDLVALYRETVDNAGGTLRYTALPPLSVPFQRFVIEWHDAESMPSGLRHLSLCVFDGSSISGDVLTAEDFMVGPVNSGTAYGIVRLGANTFYLSNAKAVSSVRLYPREDAPQWAADDLAYYAGIVGFTLSLMGCKNVKRTEARLPRSIRRHSADGNGSTGDVHYTLDIPGANEFRAATAGATGESQRKRLHIVRGHFADYTEGSGLFGKLHGRYYIAPHVRGSAARGTVTKDYNVVPA